MIAKEKFLNNSLSYLYKQIRKVYLNSNIYNRKISRVFDGGLNYVPNLSLLNCIIKSKERNFRIEDFSLEDVWNKIDLNEKDFRNTLESSRYLISTGGWSCYQAIAVNCYPLIIFKESFLWI